MQLRRRRLLQLSAASIALPINSQIAIGQAYPSRPVRILVPVAAGGAPDLTARMIGQWLSERLGQQFVVENRPGAGGNIATESLVKAPPDGHTLGLVGPGSAVSAALYEKLSFDFLRDTTPVASLVRIPLVIVVNPVLPVRNVQELIAYSKEKPLNMASAGTGSPNHMAGELFKMMTKIDMAHVPYRGSGPALIDLLGGEVQVIFSTIPAAIEFIKVGRLRAIAVTTAERADVLPDVPSIGEAVQGYEMNSWAGLVARAGTSPAIVNKLHDEINTGLASQKLRSQFGDLGATPFVSTPAEFGAFLAEETAKWGRVVKFAGIKPE